MKALVNVFLALVFSFSFPSCQEGKIGKEMARFDEVFASLFYYTYKKDAEQAERYCLPVQGEWLRLKERYRKIYTQDKSEWKYSVDIIDQWLDEAVSAVKEESWEEAYTKLDHVRYELMQIRECEEISYFLDAIWDFQMAFQLTEDVANDPMLCLMPWEEFQGLIRDMNRYWLEVEKGNPDTGIFRWDDGRRERFSTLKEEIAKELEALNAVADCAEREKIARSCELLEPRIFQMIRLFGDTINDAPLST